MKVEVVLALPREARTVTLDLAPGATVRDALAAGGFPERPPVGVFGQRVPLDHKLAPGDRVEVYRPLTMDPKEARRRRARKT